MSPSEKSLRICKNGHEFYKSSSCPVCPICEKNKKVTADFLTLIAAPARRALEAKGINTLVKLSKYSESEILDWHGMGPKSIPILKNALQEKGLKFKERIF